MVRKLRITGFRSIERQELNLSEVNIIYGGTASGKSSLIYSLLVLKNFIANPTHHTDALFNLGFIELGGFDACVFNHGPDRAIEIHFSSNEGDYGLSLKKNSGEIICKSEFLEMKTKIPIPYALNQSFTFPLKIDNDDFTVNWNGINVSVTPKEPTAENQEIARKVVEKINSIPQALKSIDIVPHRRGFFKTIYTPTNISNIPTTEDEVASIIINNPNLAPKISIDLEKIIGRDFRLYTPPGTATVYFKSTDKSARMPTDLVNDGFGVNQLVYMLAKIHRPEIKLILIEEPEIHLHPTIIRSFVRTICSIAKEEEKQFTIVTHSENFVSSLLTSVAEKLVSPENIKIYLSEKKGKVTGFNQQNVNENGQVEGGLSSFVEGELEDLKILLKIKE